ncbi:MAG: LLM class F420-dependent oxidoreductase [Actinomycetota bacterium]|nr:LLM class F420-dependent oxidoreductase [Actinomycetota bacterium]
MKVGFLPSYRNAAIATPDYALGVARAAEDAGCESIWAVEHVVIPADYASRYPYAASGRMPLAADQPVPDPLDWLAFVAAGTTTLRLATGMLVLPEHQPVALAKRLATIDALSGGRLMVGVGVGWLREESEALGVDFDERGARCDEYVEVLRALWADGPSSFEGRFVRFEAMLSVPKPVQPGGVPVVVGGHSPAAARRAGRLGHGFYPLGTDPEGLGPLLVAMRKATGDAGRDPDAVEVTVGATFDLDVAKRFADLGVGRMIVSARGDTEVEGVRRLVERFTDDVASRLR